MKTEVHDDQEILAEAISILMDKMPPSKVARLLAFLQVGRGDYTETRHKLFEGETVDSLYEQILAKRSRNKQ